MFILDTNVVSELRKAKAGKADINVTKWAVSVPIGSLYVSAITLFELEIDILKIERRDSTQGTVLRAWLETHVLPAFEGRVLPIDSPVARQCARLHVPDPQSERDALIASTALVHRMTLVTRNVADFQHTGAAILNPWLAI